MATLAEFVNKVGFKVNQSDVAKVNSTMAGMKATATKLLGAVGIGLSLSGIKNFVQSCITISSEVEEMQNKFNVVFKGMTDDVEQWATNYSDAIGRNANDIKTYLADMQNLLVGFMGQDMRQQAAQMAEAMTTMALDLASFNNIDENVAVNAMQKAVMGETEAAKTLGAVLTDVTRAEAMMTLGLEGKYEALDQATKMQVNYQAIVNQSADAIGDCERSVNSYRSTLIAFQSKLKEIKTLVGQFFMPVAQKVLKWGTNSLTSLRNLITKLNDFADAVGGAEYILGVFGAALGLTALVTAIPKIKKLVDTIKTLGVTSLLSMGKILLIAAAFLLLSLAVEDFIAFMQGRDSLFGDLLEKAGIDTEVVRDKIIGAWESVKSFLASAWGFIKNIGSTIWGGLKELFTENSDSIFSILTSIWTIISTLVIGKWNQMKTTAITVFSLLKQFWNTWGGTIMAYFSGAWDTIKSAFSTALDLMANVLRVFSALIQGDWEGAWEAIKQLLSDAWNGILGTASMALSTRWGLISAIFSSIWGTISGIATSIWSTITTTFTNIWTSVVGIVNNIWTAITTAFNNMWTGVTTTVGNIKTSIIEGFQAAIDWITGLPAQALTWGSDIVSNIAQGIRNGIGQITEAVQGVAGKISSFLHFSEPDVGPLSNFHTYMPDMIDLMSKGIKAGRAKVQEAAQLLSGDMAAILNVGQVSSATAAGVRNSSVKNNIVQNVNINNKFEGDRAGQQKSANAMHKASGDATAEMARALVFAK